VAKKKNTLTKHVQEVHRTLASANFVAFASDTAAGRDRQQMQTWIDAGNGDRMILGAAVMGRDTYGDPFAAINYGAQNVTLGDTIQLIDEANAIAQADAIANGFEAMEAFVKNVTAEYLYGKRGQIPILQKVRQRAKNQFGKKAAAENTKPYFRQIVHVLAGRNCDPLFKILFKDVDGLRDRVATWRFGDLHEIHQAVEAIRHCKAHVNGRYDQDNFKSYPVSVQRFLRSCAKKSMIHGDARVMPTHKDASWLLTREAEYSQILYDALSTELGMKLDYKPN